MAYWTPYTQGWTWVTGEMPHTLLDTLNHTDTTTQAPTRGSLVVADVLAAWNELVIGAAGRVLRSDGLDAVWAVLSHADLGGVTADQHHAQLHASTHIPAGGDVLQATQTNVVFGRDSAGAGAMEEITAAAL